MISLQTVINNTKSFQELQPILVDAQADITFYGIRYIKSKKFSGIYFLDDLARRIEGLIKILILKKETNNFAIYLGNRITQFYDDTNSCVHKNIFTRICYKIREFWMINIDPLRKNDKGIRFFWNVSYDSLKKELGQINQ